MVQNACRVFFAIVLAQLKNNAVLLSPGAGAVVTGERVEEVERSALHMSCVRGKMCICW